MKIAFPEQMEAFVDPGSSASTPRTDRRCKCRDAAAPHECWTATRDNMIRHTQLQGVKCGLICFCQRACSVWRRAFVAAHENTLGQATSGLAVTGVSGLCSNCIVSRRRWALFSVRGIEGSTRTRIDIMDVSMRYGDPC